MSEEAIKKGVEVKIERGKTYIGWTVKVYDEDDDSALKRAVGLDERLQNKYETNTFKENIKETS